MKIKSDNLAKKLILISKAFGKKASENATIKLETTTIGLQAYIITDNGSITFIHKDVEIIDDGVITLEFQDIIDLISTRDTIEIKKEHDNILVNNFTLFESEMIIDEQQIIGDNTEIKNTEAVDWLNNLKTNNKLLKKSIFKESEYVLVNVLPNKINNLYISPYELQTFSTEIIDNNVKMSFILNKAQVKILTTLLNKEKIAIIKSDKLKIQNEDFIIVFDQPNINIKMFFPTYKTR